MLFIIITPFLKWREISLKMHGMQDAYIPSDQIIGSTFVYI